MTNFFSLLKVQMLSFLGLNKILHSKKSKKLSGLGGLLFVAVLCAFGVGFYAYNYVDMQASMYAYTDELYKVLPQGFALLAVICMFFTFYSSSNVLYGFKDYDIISSMPIKTSTVVLSKLVYMYASELAFFVVATVGMLIAYFEYAVTITAVQIVFVVVTLLTLPLIPMAISLFLGALCSFIASRFKKKNLVQNFLMLFFLIGCFALGFLSGSGLDVFNMLGRLYVILPWLENGFNNLAYVLLFASVSIAVAVAFLSLVILTYKRMNTLLKSNRTKSNYKVKGSYKQKSVFFTLLKKEAKQFFSCMIYVMNSLVGAVMTVFGAVIMIVLFKAFGVSADSNLVLIFTAVVAFSAMIAPTTNCSISIEGQTFWVIKTAPVSMRTLFNVKLLFNAIIYSSTALLSSLLFTIILGAKIELVLLSAYTVIMITLFGGNVGLMMNAIFPVLKWENPNKVVKQSLSVVLTMLVGFLFAGVVIFTTIKVAIDATYLLLIIAGAATVLAVLSYLFIMIKCPTMLLKRS